jgi:hypothetical protein
LSGIIFRAAKINKNVECWMLNVELLKTPVDYWLSFEN